MTFLSLTYTKHPGLLLIWMFYFYQTVHQFYDPDTELDIYRIKSSFNGAFTMVVKCKQATLNLVDTWFHPFVIMLKLLRLVFLNLPWLFSTFHLKYPPDFLDFAHKNTHESDMVELLSSWLAERGVRGSIPCLANWISSSDVTHQLLKQRKSLKQLNQMQTHANIFCTLHQNLFDHDTHKFEKMHMYVH